MFLFILVVFLLEALPTGAEAPLNLSNVSFLWGPYRPNLYFGIRPRIPNSLLMGLMWSDADETYNFLKNLRHTCEQDEGMAGYGWTAYDVRKGGTQLINDTKNNLDLIIQFAKAIDTGRLEKWGSRITGISRSTARDDQRTAVIFYIGSQDSNSSINCTKENKISPTHSDIVCEGATAGLNNFKVKILDHGTDSLQRISVKSLTVPAGTIWQAKTIFVNAFNEKSSHEGMIADDPGEGNLHFVQIDYEGEFEFDVLFSSSSQYEATTPNSLTKDIQDALSTFNQQFQTIYSPQAPFQDGHYTKFSQSLLSNLLGGIGYFHGKSKIDNSAAPEYAEADINFWETAGIARSHGVIEEQGPYQLFTAVPSRPFFPRGFLWDEGFHLLVLLDWDIDLTLEIISSWFDLMDENGWISREQILGPEARSKVPLEFQTQYPHYANPPTLFMVVQAFVTRLSGEVPFSGAPSRYLSDPAVGREFLKSLYPKMKKHYNWFRRTQAGNLKNYQLPDSKIYQGYRWRGRTPQHTLTSGLDDYPRAQPPHPEELHVDALCWVGSMAVALRNIAASLGENEDQMLFSKHETDIIRSIDRIHWSEPDQVYCDTTVVDGNRVEKIRHKGYISLFPFLVGFIGSDHPNLEAVLNLIEDPEELWTPYGIRSLSRKDKYYGTEENYWRSPIWININYMVLQRLFELAQEMGAHQHRIRGMYTKLRLNLGSTVFKSWKETGFAWEQYNPDTGKGQRTQSFTGWTALIVKILAMPNLQPVSQPQLPGYIHLPASKGSWRMTLVLTTLGIIFICFVFRRRLVKALRGLMGA